MNNFRTYYCHMCEKKVLEPCWFKRPSHKIADVDVITCENMPADRLCSFNNRQAHISNSLSAAVKLTQFSFLNRKYDCI
jgi:hypothetical protein